MGLLDNLKNLIATEEAGEDESYARDTTSDPPPAETPPVVETPAAVVETPAPAAVGGPPPTLTPAALTLEDVRGMSRNDINARWEEVSAVLKARPR